MITTPRILLPHRHGFSLVELLLAVFILGIGIIGISALFPAGIAQQRQANDDIMGPIVADNAMALLRSRLKPEWFGTMEEFDEQPDELFPNGSPSEIHRDTVPGDWEWKRPGFLFTNTPEPVPESVPAPVMDKVGAIDIFSAYVTSFQAGTPFGAGLDVTKVATETRPPLPPPGGLLRMYGIPYNSVVGLPIVLFSQAERSYPVVTPDMITPDGVITGPNKVKRPAFFWECMFRRFAGRIQVAVFVYRVGDGGGEPREYIVAQGGPGNLIPPLPMLADLSVAPFMRLRFGGWDGVSTTFADNALVFKTTATPPIATELIPLESWQHPGQWILDEYNTVHRVLSGRRTSKDLEVSLARPIPAQPPLAELFGNIFFSDGTTNGSIPTDPGARFIWFMPTSDANGFSIVPVFVTVQEL